METKSIVYLSIAPVTYAFTHIIDKLGIQRGIEPGVFAFFRILIMGGAILITKMTAIYEKV